MDNSEIKSLLKSTMRNYRTFSKIILFVGAYNFTWKILFIEYKPIKTTIKIIEFDCVT